MSRKNIQVSGASIFWFVVFVVLILAAVVAFWTWLVMLAFGIAHGSNDAIPAIGFWTSLPFGVLFTLASASNNRK